MGRYKAVVFDLWGTLVDELTYPEANRLVYRQKTNETNDLLGLDRDRVRPGVGSRVRTSAWWVHCRR